jgi:leader peptidase (prepilin peptidase)/N-methyltransferase
VGEQRRRRFVLPEIRRRFARGEETKALVLDALTACWLGVIGACIGSFLNVVAYRMPRGMSVVWKPSHCPRCGHDIRMRDNVPVLGWLLLRGRCRDCGAPIAARYAIVEALIGLAFAWLAWAELLSGGANLPGGPLISPAGATNMVINPNWPLIGLFAFHGILMSLLMAILLIDWDNNRAPWLFALMAAVVVGIAATHHPTWYPDRGGSLFPLTAPQDAALGAALGAVAWGVLRSGPAGRGAASTSRAFNLGLALAAVGAFLGLRAAICVLVAWGIAAVACRLLMRGRWSANWQLALIWPITLIFIIAWRQIAALTSW